MTILQNCLRNLCNKGEISKSEVDQMRPKNEIPARAHGLLEIHKTFINIPKFRTIIDTTGSNHDLVGQYVAQLLYPMKNNEFTLKDSFEVVNHIQDIPSSLFLNGYKYVPFDVESLFTKVPIKETINAIPSQIYNDHIISTNLKKHSLKKLILDTCTKIAFSFSNIIYVQKDGVSMGSSLGPVRVNIITTESENKVIKPLMKDGTIKFYCQYVDDTLLVMKPKDVSRIHKLLNSFDKIDLFENGSSLFSGLGNVTGWKDTSTGLYVNYTSFVTWTNCTT